MDEAQALATVGEALCWAAMHVRYLNPRLGAEVLLAHVLNTARERLIAHPEQGLTAEEAGHYRELVERCAAGEPLYYLLGRREFYGLEFAVDARVLIPRPETEHVVEAALDWAGRTGHAAPRAVDVGTGSGAIAVTLAVKLPGAWVAATDVSAGALAVARANAVRHGVADRMAFVAADLLAPLAGPFDLIVANLPYVSCDEMGALDADANVVAHEPHVALDGGTDGLALLRRFLTQAPARLRPGGALFMEIGAGQAARVTALAAEAFPAAEVGTIRDYGGHRRVVSVISEDKCQFG